MPAKKGTRPPAAGMGRKKGAKNKIPAEIKKYVLDIDAKLTKENKGLLARAQLDPDWFYTVIYSRIIPKSIEGKFEHDLTEPMRAEALRLLREHWKKTGRAQAKRANSKI